MSFKNTIFKLQSTLPVLVDTVSPLVEGQRFDLVLADLAGLGLQSGGNICLQGPILSLNRPHLARQIVNTLFFTVLHRTKSELIG